MLDEFDPFDDDPAELPEDVELMFTVECYQDEEGDLYVCAEGNLSSPALRSAVARRLSQIAESLDNFAEPDRVH
jgi:hypothetical protein